MELETKTPKILFIKQKAKELARAEVLIIYDGKSTGRESSSLKGTGVS